MEGKKKIAYVKETWRDPENTLSQSIMYKYNDERDKWCMRKRLNPHVTNLIWTVYMDEDWEIVYEEEGE